MIYTIDNALPLVQLPQESTSTKSVCCALQGDVLLQWHACQVLYHIANASPADYTQLAVKEGALVLVTGAMRGFPAHPQLQTAAIWFLDVCAALQPLHDMLMREHVVALCCGAIR